MPLGVGTFHKSGRKTAAVMIENRVKTRGRIFTFGTIKCGSGRRVFSVVRNLSKIGAVLEVDNALRIPDEFTLIVEGHLFARSCRVAWRKPKRIGIDFV
jgi:hypothetical protein